MLKKFIFIIFLCHVNGFNVSSYVRTVLNLSNDPKFQQDLIDQLNYVLSLDKNYFNFKPNITFDCNISYSEGVVREPTTVHTLKPTDIKVIAALGDSLTAAIGGEAKLVPELLIEYRGFYYY